MRGITTFGLIGMPLACLILGVGGLLALAYMFRVRGTRLLYVEVFVLSFLLRIGLIFLNEHYLIFEHKVAGERSLLLYQKYLLGIGGFANLYSNLLQFAKEQFAVQTLINAPFFAAFGEDLMTILYSNALFGAITGSVAALMLHNAFGEKVAQRALILFALYPASINFSIFGLRDPLIYFFMTVFAIAAISSYMGLARTFHILVSGVAAVCMLLLRPELAYVVVALVGLLIFPSVIGSISPHQRPIERWAVAGVFFAVAGVFTVAMAILSLKVAAAQIGAASINPADFAGENAVERFERSEDSDFGGGSHLMSGDLYRNLPAYVRVPIQTAGLVILPFPWMITGIAQAFAFLDSLFLMGLMFLASLYLRRRSRFRVVVWGLLLSYCVGILGMGFIVSNAGNGFRMRFGVVPLCLLAGSFSSFIPTFRLHRD